MPTAGEMFKEIQANAGPGIITNPKDPRYLLAWHGGLSPTQAQQDRLERYHPLVSPAGTNIYRFRSGGVAASVADRILESLDSGMDRDAIY